MGKTDLKEPSPFGDLSNVLSAPENKPGLALAEMKKSMAM